MPARFVLAATGLVIALAGCGSKPASTTATGVFLEAEPGLPTPAASPAPTTVPSPAPLQGGLKTIDYTPAPKGFPADPASSSTAPITEGLHVTQKTPVYDAPGGKARAYLAPTISGVQLIMPIVAHQATWVAVLLPSVNRTVGWLPPGHYTTTALHDQVLVDKSAHTLTWLRDGAAQGSWTVTIGAPKTPTPLGRTFVLGHSTLPGKVYAGVDALALGAVPDNPDTVATGLKGAHIGIHAWYKDDFGYNKSNGCVRMPKAAQEALLGALPAGTPIVVVA
jgi:lipoprotein-anchoring transpeptidase ErfK/SrfK